MNEQVPVLGELSTLTEMLQAASELVETRHLSTLEEDATCERLVIAGTMLDGLGALLILKLNHCHKLLLPHMRLLHGHCSGDTSELRTCFHVKWSSYTVMTSISLS